jgi:FkbM family methyltransferase
MTKYILLILIFIIIYMVTFDHNKLYTLCMSTIFFFTVSLFAYIAHSPETVTSSKYSGGYQSKKCPGILKTINVITKNKELIESAKMIVNYNVDFYDEYPTYNTPSFITITDIIPTGELPSTHILLYNKSHARATRFDTLDLLEELNRIKDPISPETIELYNVGEHIFTNKPPTADTFNYDDSYDIWVDTRDNFIKKVVASGIPYEKYMTACLSSFIEPNATILDVGANIGTVSLPLSRLHNCSVKVISFEPFPHTYAILSKNIELNKTFNIIPMKILIGEKPRDSVSLTDEVVGPQEYKNKNKLPEVSNVHSGDAIHFGAVQIGTGSIKARMITIDELKINISAMKVDVEGAEPLVFQGAKNTIKRCMPVIVFEHNEKILSKNMKKILGISDKKDFNILEYCYSLGYRDFYELDIQDYMLVPPGRKQIEMNSIAKFKRVKKISGINAKKYNLYKFVRPRW